ncbi:O-acetyl-ADP-ribose deacetylase [Gordonia sp. HNM0687]|uniref:O-acetyl-ADP-ribose deacetylase n=1 Tax=Gordonia mangrovi TaxID=2665643 RepID=A0A6L7GME0_9ACTN|nr:O-acetyl-ADP-ribose deacetylase [Gordonia mangrovi]MDY6807850.1 O-acetyl-ADP-ribose deacetylase [Actinomycetota bacterium]MXP20663.1 O-acetyl-ADP-ribose deacetylase [Gordonia mangrovi]UVF78759.1 O-acetyl-ADP-ribose deacetylase [Gordonia mangrovi]
MATIEVTVGDITTQRVDAIVNAANSSLLGGGGVDGAIHRAGGPAILAECRLLRETSLPSGLESGAAVATTGGDLPSRWVIHTVGPVYSASDDRSVVLRSCYTRSLLLANALGAASIAFPLISGGAYGWPLEDAVEQQIRAVKGADSTVESVTLVAFSSRIADITRRILA